MIRADLFRHAPKDRRGRVSPSGKVIAQVEFARYIASMQTKELGAIRLSTSPINRALLSIAILRRALWQKTGKKQPFVVDERLSESDQLDEFIVGTYGEDSQPYVWAHPLLEFITRPHDGKVKTGREMASDVSSWFKENLSSDSEGHCLSIGMGHGPSILFFILAIQQK